MPLIKTMCRLGGLMTLIILAIALLRQLIALVGFLLVVVKLAVIVGFVGLMLLIILSVLRGRTRRRNEPEEL